VNTIPIFIIIVTIANAVEIVLKSFEV